LKIGILAAGAPPGALIPTFGDYPAMFRTLLADGGHDWRDYDVRRGEWPASVEDHQAYLVTGSACGVYDPEPWIGDLKRFLVEASGRAALVGVCFGHQVMAEAFGGAVIKSPKGWGIGLHAHAVRRAAPWMDAVPAYALAASHQDQVVQVPSGAEVLAGSDFCPNGMLAYAGGRAMSLQLHPEFAPAYAQALIAGRRGVRFGEAEADRAIASLEAPDDHRRVAGWIEAFLAQRT
jgi:GMP synthase-like glutamine amidotransferase